MKLQGTPCLVLRENRTMNRFNKQQFLALIANGRVFPENIKAPADLIQAEVNLAIQQGAVISALRAAVGQHGFFLSPGCVEHGRLW
jgi:hypothetical protein